MKANPVASLHAHLSRPSIPRPQPPKDKNLITSHSTNHNQSLPDSWHLDDFNDQPFASLPHHLESLPDWSSEYLSFQPPPPPSSSLHRHPDFNNVPFETQSEGVFQRRLNSVQDIRPIFHHPVSSFHATSEVLDYRVHETNLHDVHEAEDALNKAFLELDVEEEQEAKDEAEKWRDEFLASLSNENNDNDKTNTTDEMTDESVREAARSVLSAIEDQDISERLKEKLKRSKFMTLMKKLESGEARIRENNVHVP